MLSTGSSYPREQGSEADQQGALVRPSYFNAAGLQIAGNQCRLLLGSAPYEPRVAIPFHKIAVSGDLNDLQGYLNTTGASIGTVLADLVKTTTVNTQNANIGTVLADLVNTTTLNAQNAYLDYTASQQVETESITTNGQQIIVDWFATDTDLPVIALKNNPFQFKQNSDKSKAGFQIQDVFIGAAEGLAGDALLYLGKAAGGWLLNAAQAGLSMMNGYAAISEAGLSLGADAASFAAGVGGDAAIFEAGAEGMVLASSASEAASLFSSAGVLAEGGVGFSSELGEVGQALLGGLENSSGSFVSEAAPDFFDTLLGSARWVAL